MRLLPMLFLVLACGDAGDSGDVNDAYPPSIPLETRFTECTVAADCVAVELGCCDECNGGFAVAVNTDSVAAVTAEFAEVCGVTQGCTEMGCPAWELSCDAGVCAMVRGTF